MHGHAVATVRANPPALVAIVAAQALLQLLDLATTYLALGAGAVEANPISRTMIEDGGWGLYAGVKVALAVGFVALMPLQRWLEPRDQRFVVRCMLVFAAIMFAVVSNNLWILLAG